MSGAAAATSHAASAADSRASREHPDGTHVNDEAAGHAEVIRALGSVLLTPPPGCDAVLDALGLPLMTGADHTDAFVLSAPPFAAIHLGDEGKLGGEGQDRVAGFWRALGLKAPEDADQLGALLMLLAQLEADGQERSHAALFHEHIASWAPAYLRAVAGLGLPAVTAWAELLLELLDETAARLGPPPQLPLALREAPASLSAGDDLVAMLDTLVAPVRCGFVLTYRDLAAGAKAAGVGLRRGERRYALKAMLEQDPTATLAWLTEHAQRCAQAHTAPYGVTSQWWSERATATAGALAEGRGT